MVAKRIIPCLDVRDGKTVKGVHFLDLREVGDAVDLGAKYAAEGADELVYLDISATLEGRKTFTRLVSSISERIDIPFTVGGGISSLADAARLLEAGADKVSINSAAIRTPGLIDEIAGHFGNQFVVVAIDARKIGDRWTATTHGGSRPCGSLTIPVIASGGAGSIGDIAEVLTEGKADAALAASIFHYGEIPIPTLKAALAERGIAIRQ